MTQHLLNGAPEVTATADELEDIADSPGEVQFVSTKKLNQQNNMAIMHVVMDVTGPQGKTFKAVA